MAILVVLIILLILLTFLGAFGGSIRYKESYYNEDRYTSSEYPIVHPSQMQHVQGLESYQGVEIPETFQHPSGMVDHQSMETYNEEPEQYQEHEGHTPVEPFEDDKVGAPY
jgi:hypothetical protein